MTTTASFRLPHPAQSARSVPFALAAAACAMLSSAALAQDVKESAEKLQFNPGMQAATPMGNAADAPLRFDAERHDWGRVTDASRLAHTFKFTNISRDTITIQNVSATCGCTVPQLTKRVYAPGETGEINVQFDPTNRRGPQTKQVTITFADPAIPAMRLDLSSHVLPMLWVEPNRVFFNENFKGTGGTQRVVVTARNTDFQITGMEEVQGRFSVRVVSTEDTVDDSDPVRKMVLEVSLSPDAPIGNHNTQLVFKSNEPKWPEFKVMAQAIVVGELKADPPSVLIRTQQPNTPFEAMAIIETRHSTPFEITDVDWSIDGGHDLSFVVDWEDFQHQRGKPTYLLRMSGVTPPVTAQIRATITVKTNLGEDEQIPVVLWGTVRGPEAPRPMPASAEIPGVKPNAIPINPGATPQGLGTQKPGSN